MASVKVENYAHRYGLSNRKAKKRLGKGARTGELKFNLPVRGAPIAGTGRPKGE